MHRRLHGRNGAYYCNGFTCSRIARDEINEAPRAAAAGGSPRAARARARSARLWVTQRMRFLYVRAPTCVPALSARCSA
eukprot:2403842-Pleurochrysis_carterae.AAC.1